MLEYTYRLIADNSVFTISDERLPICRLTQFDKLVYEDDAYIVDYDPIAFSALLASYRWGYEHCDDYTYIIVRHLLSLISPDEDNYKHIYINYLQPDTVADRVIIIYNVANKRNYRILLSTLARFPNSVWYKKVSGEFKIDESIIVDINEYTLDWILKLYRGSIHPRSMQSTYVNKDITYRGKLEALYEALTYLNLPNGFTGVNDLVLYNTKKYPCPKCFKVLDNLISTVYNYQYICQSKFNIIGCTKIINTPDDGQYFRGIDITNERDNNLYEIYTTDYENEWEYIHDDIIVTNKTCKSFEVCRMIYTHQLVGKPIRCECGYNAHKY